MFKKLKVFHGLVNYGSQAGLLSKELRRRNIISFSATNSPDKFKREIDYELKNETFFSKYFNRLIKLYWFFKYNTFHFYFGKTLFHNQIDLPYYRFFKKKVIMEHLGNDIRNYKYLISKYGITPSPDKVKYDIEEKDEENKLRIANEEKYIDYRLVCNPNQCSYVSANEILPLALDLGKFEYTPKVINDEITIMHAPTDRIFKGTNTIIAAIDELKEEGYKIDFRLIENVSHDELIKEYKECDIFIDQISIGWYGTASLEAMAIGRTTCAFINEEYFKYIDYGDNIPVINVNKDNITNVLTNLINNRVKLEELGKKGRKFVENFHDVEKVGEKLIYIYSKAWNNSK